MIGTKISAGMWRVDPLNHMRVIDRFGRIVATAESETDASLIASAPDMYEVLDGVEKDDAVPPGLWEEVQLVLRRARGDIGMIFSCCGRPRLRQIWTQDWLQFVAKLWNHQEPRSE
jgi:hypothetical protein